MRFFEPFHDAIGVDIGLRCILVQRKAVDDFACFCNGQGRKRGAATGGAKGRHAVANERCVKGFAFALHAQGIDHAGFVIEAEVDPL